MSGNELDPRHLSQVTGHSFEAWERSVDAARWSGMPEPDLVKLVNAGASPAMIAALDAYRDALRRALIGLGETIRQAGEAIAAFKVGSTTPPTGVRERALWLAQHRGTGPNHGPIWAQGRRP